MARNLGNRGRSRNAVARRQPTTWTRIVTQPVVVAAASKVFLTFLLLNNPGIGETIRRTRGRFYVGADVGILENQLGAWGGMVVTDIAAAAGAASLPGPITEANDDGWFMWEGFTQESISNTGGLPAFVYEFDSKAMRRVEEGSQIVFMVENASATFGLSFSAAISVLTSLS